MMNADQLSILLVDDRDDFRLPFAEWLMRDMGHKVSEAKTFEEALAQVSQGRFDLAVVDYSLDPGGEGNGLDLMAKLHTTEPELPVILITGFGNRPIVQQALRAGALWYVDKPPDPVELEVLLARVLRSRDRPPTGTREVFPQAIASAITLDELFAAVSGPTADFLKATYCEILMVDPADGSLQRLPSIWSDRPPAQDSELQDILRRCSFAGVPTLERDLSMLRDPAPVPNHGALAVVPCPPQPESGGLLIAYFDHPLDDESARETVQSLAELTRIVGVKLEHFQAQRLEAAVDELGQDLLRALSGEEVYDAIKDILVKHVAAASFYLSLYDHTTRELSFPIVYDTGRSISLPAKILEELPEGEYSYFTEYVIREGTPRELAGAAAIAASPIKLRSVGTAAIQSYFAVPIRLSDDRPAFGALSIQSKSSRRFSPSIKAALAAISKLAAPTLGRMRRIKLGEEVINHIPSRSLDEVIVEIAQALKELVFADVVSLYAFEPERQRFTPPLVEIPRSDPRGPETWESEERSLKRLLSLRKHFAADVEADDCFKGAWLEKLGAQSSAGVILSGSVEGGVQGALLLHFKAGRNFSAVEETEVIRFGERAAAALAIARLVEEQRNLQRRNDAEVAAIAAADERRDRLALLVSIGETARQVWAPHSVDFHILLVDRGSGALQYLDGTPVEEKEAEPPSLRRIVCSRAAWTIVQGNEAGPAPRLLNPTNRSAVCGPVKVGDSLFALLNVESSEVGAFGDRDKLFLERLARVLANTLVTAERRPSLKLIADVAARAAEAPESALHMVAKTAHELASDAGGAPTSTTIFLVRGEALELACVVPCEVEDAVCARFCSLPLTAAREGRRGVVVRAALEKKTQFIRNIQDDADYLDLDQRTKAELAVPVLAADRSAVGVLNLEFQNPDSLDDEDRFLVEALADQALVVTLLQGQALRLAETERKNTVAASLAILGLDKTDSSHRFGGAIGTMLGEVTLCQRALAKISVAHRGRMYHLLRWCTTPTAIIRTQRQISVSLERLKKVLVSNQSTGRLEQFNRTETLPVSAWLKKVRDDWAESEPQVSFESRLTAEHGDAVAVNEYWLRRGFDNIVANAVRATKGRQSRVVTLGDSRIGADKIRLEVHDNGPGIRREVAKSLFQKELDTRLVEHQGTGCLITSFIASAYGGRALVLPDESPGAHVAIELPSAEPGSRLLF